MKNSLPENWSKVLDDKFAEYKCVRTDKYPCHPEKKLFDDYVEYGNLKRVSEINDVPLAWIKEIAKQHKFTTRAAKYWFPRSKGSYCLSISDTFSGVFEDIVVFYHVIGFSNEEINDKLKNWISDRAGVDYRHRIRYTTQYVKKNHNKRRPLGLSWYVYGPLTLVLSMYLGDEKRFTDGYCKPFLKRLHDEIYEESCYGGIQLSDNNEWYSEACDELMCYLNERNLLDDNIKESFDFEYLSWKQKHHVA